MLALFLNEEALMVFASMAQALLVRLVIVALFPLMPFAIEEPHAFTHLL